ncbi:MAG: hypothetical protein H7321_04395 [Bacteroidia bacterium]|nr:hypothetical protein [Bacteroidia bacterium]
MENIQLNNITKDHVYGKWEVKERINKSNQENVFNSIKLIEIENGLYKSNNGRENSGKLLLIRETEIIYNPQLVFFINEDKIASAIITRLFSESSGDKKYHYLTLYFTTGLELILQKIN